MKKPTIVCVDDEKIVLDSLKAQFKTYFKGNCDIYTAESGDEAIEIIEEIEGELGEPPSLVICDQIMPKMKGDEVLAVVNERFPKTLKILLTGLANKEDIISAINKAGLYRYISKPWDKTDLNITVKEALISHEKAREIEEQKNQLIELNKGLERKVKERTLELEAEKEKTDGLLLNILPFQVAKELKEEGHATARHYDKVTVLFTDIKNFTNIARVSKAEEIVSRLDALFQAFDDITGRYNLEKIKTIGDSYMCAGGIPEPNASNPHDAIHAAFEMQRFLTEWNAKQGLDPALQWQLRIGLHTGDLIAGVVGKKKFAYDIWGDTVNVASRMESNGEPGRINVSGETYRYVRDSFRCTSRGKLAVKGLGEVEMYFVDDAK